MSRIFSTIYVALLLAITGQVVAAPRVAVVDFDDRTGYRTSWRIGVGAADMLTTELVKATKLEVFEREQMKSVLAEQDFGMSGRVDPSTAARMGKLIGVDYIITGAVTEFGIAEGGGGGRGIRIGKKGYGATVDIRMIEVETGRIVFADSGDGRKNLTRVSVMGIGGGVNSNTKAETEVMRLAIKDLTKKMNDAGLEKSLKASNKPRMAPSKPGTVIVAAIDGNDVTLTKDSRASLKSGSTYKVRRQTGTIKHPETGAVIKVKYKTVGQVKVTTVEDTYADGVLTSNNGVEVGDQVDSPKLSKAPSKPAPVAKAKPKPEPEPEAAPKKRGFGALTALAGGSNVSRRSRDDIEIDDFDEDALEDYYDALKSSVQFLGSIAGLSQTQYEQSGMDVASVWTGMVYTRMETTLIEFQDWPADAREKGWKILGRKILKYNKLFNRHRDNVLKSDFYDDSFKSALRDLELLDGDNLHEI